MNINTFFSETLKLGSNWRTSISGSLVVVCGTIALYPDLISFLPDTLESYVLGISKLVAVISGGAFAMNAKDKQVTGGNVPSTREAKRRVSLDEVKK